jgi:L,D-peptidoglycan transpeptidase YkuD (ErfK/YbiS/YcfS/YnhG family)
MNIKINKHYLLYKDFKIRCCIGKSGIKKAKKEGDLSTPKGTFKIGLLYYRKDRIKLPNCKIKKKFIKKNMGWCTDSRSQKYNKEVYFPTKYRAEKLYRKTHVYDLIIHIKHNCLPTKKYKGSAIFLHVARKNYKKTEGCVAISKKDFLKLIPLIEKKTFFTIY